MSTNIFIELKIQKKTAIALARAGIRAEHPVETIKSKILKITRTLQNKHLEFSPKIANLLDPDLIYTEALEQELALV